MTDSEGEETLFTADATAQPRKTTGLIAPWWHTALLVVLIMGLSATGARQMQNVASRPLHLTPNYILTIAYEWVLAALVLWGIHLRRVPVKQLLGQWQSGLRGWVTDFGAALAFWLVALALLSLIAVALLHTLGSHVDPRKIGDVTQKLAPTTLAEMFLFLILSLSAGICEEFVFRGYLQQQFARMGGGVWIGVLVSALVFGCAHGYEGVAGVLLIAAYGAMFSVLTLMRRGLRTGMIAHAWHDSVSGMALVLLRHYGSHLGAK
jgi:CAAX protease family protein